MLCKNWHCQILLLATTTTTISSIRCTCQTGYTGNGTVCYGSLLEVCWRRTAHFCCWKLTCSFFRSYKVWMTLDGTTSAFSFLWHMNMVLTDCLIVEVSSLSLLQLMMHLISQWWVVLCCSTTYSLTYFITVILQWWSYTTGSHHTNTNQCGRIIHCYKLCHYGRTCSWNKFQQLHN